MSPEQQYARTLVRRCDALEELCRRVIEVHEHVVMDTPEDRDLHDRACKTFREALAVAVAL